MKRLLIHALLVQITLLCGLHLGYIQPCHGAEAPAIYDRDEESGLAVPEEFKLKYQVPDSWLLHEDQADFLGAKDSWRGNLAINYRYFVHDGLSTSQPRSDASLIFEPEYSLSWPGGNYAVFTPYFQLDNQDDERSHLDIREFFYSFVGENYELSLGVKKIFWGVTESQNLVDIINQSDFVANGKLSDKLGQPMANLSLIQDWGTLDLFVLPYFRERTYPGKDGRLRPSLPINTDRAQYESSAEEHHVDLALRYSQSLGELDLGLSFFKGTSRDPQIRGADYILLPGSTTPQPTVYYPYYYQMSQSGLEAQYILSGWLLKAEVIYRDSDISTYTAWTTGFEYTLTGVMATETDVSLMAEWLYDDRQNQSTSPFANDLMLGTRITFNDTNSSEITVAVIRDLDHDPCVLSIEAERRLTDHWKINLDAYWWWENQRYDALYDLRDDDYISCHLAYYF